MTIIGWNCELTRPEFKVIGKLCDNAFDLDWDHQISVKRGKTYTRIEGASIKLLQKILEYTLSAYDIYNSSKTKTIPIDYEYIGKNLQAIKDAYDIVCNPRMYYVSRYIGDKKIDEADENLDIPLFLCEERYEPIKPKKDEKKC
ncbi:MAG: hypothetical protein PUH03_02225 [bacterium]|nr:hypothetical protein [bacterium]MDY2830992.1 hypothetical protein [Alphaproteobacteria bacterium]